MKNYLANFNVKFPSTKVNQNLSTVLTTNMYKRNKLQLCIHFTYSVVTKINMNNYHPHSQYICATVFVELTSITILTKMNIITLCLLRDCTVGVGPEKIPYSKKQAKGTTSQRVILDNLENVLFVMLLQNYHDSFHPHSFHISTENTDVLF